MRHRRSAGGQPQTGDFVVADLSGPDRRFLSETASGEWVVKPLAQEAKRFVLADIARTARDQWLEADDGDSPAGAWTIYQLVAADCFLAIAR